MPDKTIKCAEKDCGKDFTFSEGEQDFYQQRGFSDPKYCKDCREKRKAAREKKGARRG